VASKICFQTNGWGTINHKRPTLRYETTEGYTRVLLWHNQYNF